MPGPVRYGSPPPFLPLRRDPAQVQRTMLPLDALARLWSTAITGEHEVRMLVAVQLYHTLVDRFPALTGRLVGPITGESRNMEDGSLQSQWISQAPVPWFPTPPTWNPEPLVSIGFRVKDQGYSWQLGIANGGNGLMHSVDPYQCTITLVGPDGAQRDARGGTFHEALQWMIADHGDMIPNEARTLFEPLPPPLSDAQRAARVARQDANEAALEAWARPAPKTANEVGCVWHVGRSAITPNTGGAVKLHRWAPQGSLLGLFIPGASKLSAGVEVSLSVDGDPVRTLRQRPASNGGLFVHDPPVEIPAGGREITVHVTLPANASWEGPASVDVRVDLMYDDASPPDTDTVA